MASRKGEKPFGKFQEQARPPVLTTSEKLLPSSAASDCTPRPGRGVGVGLNAAGFRLARNASPLPEQTSGFPCSSPPTGIYDLFVTANSQLEAALDGVHAALNHGRAVIALTSGTYKTWDEWSDALKRYCQVSGERIGVEERVSCATRMKQLQRMDKNNKARLDGLPEDTDIYSRTYVCSRGRKPRDTACGFYISVKVEKCGGEWIIRIVNANLAHDHRKKAPSEVANKQRKPKSNDHACHLKALVQKVTTIEVFLAKVEHTRPEAHSAARVERSVHAMLGLQVDLNFLDEPPFAPSISIAPNTVSSLVAHPPVNAVE